MQRILIIEDDTTIRNGIQLYLQKKRFAVDCADTIAAANTLLAKMVYHLILLDIRLPDGNGLELCSKLRETSTTPIIFLTANDTEEQMITGFQHGCDDYLAKPFSIFCRKRRIKTRKVFSSTKFPSQSQSRSKIKSRVSTCPRLRISSSSSLYSIADSFTGTSFFSTCIFVKSIVRDKYEKISSDAGF